MKAISVCLLFMLQNSAIAQSESDTFERRKGVEIITIIDDTMIVTQYNHQWQVKNRDCYINSKPVHCDYWFYSDTTYGYRRYYLNSLPKHKSIYKEFYKNGQPMIDCEMRKRKRNGYFKTYYPNGNMMCDCNFKAGKRDSINRSYYENGRIASYQYYNNGKLNDSVTYYHENGKLWTVQVYQNGLLLNVVNNFDNRGMLKDIGTLKDGNGTLLIYDENGRLTKTEYYKNGRLQKIVKAPL